jgi:phage shock protein PspC (stress-responsive transcriptional regulator)
MVCSQVHGHDGTMTEESKDRPSPAQRLPRSQDRRVLAGVCAGLGRHTRIDPVVFRVGFALLVPAGGAGIPLYILAALLMPADEVRPAPIEQMVKRRFDADAVLTILTALLGVAVLLSLPGSGPNGLDGSLTLVTVFALVLLVAHGRGVDLIQLTRTLPERIQGRPAEPHESATAPGAYGPVNPHTTQEATMRPEMVDLATLHTRPSAAPIGTYDLGDDPAEPRPSGFAPASAVARSPRRRSLLAPLTLLIALLVAAVMCPIAAAYPQKAHLPIVLGAGLAVIALGLVVGSWYGRPRGLVAVGTLLSVALVTSSVATAVPAGGRFGHVTWRPVDAGQSDQTYRVTVGQGAIDLTELPLKPGQRIKVRAELGVGEIRVRLPRTARVELHATAGLGDVTVDGRVTGGPWARVNEILQPESGSAADPPTIELSFNGKVGDLEVTRV